MTFVEEVQDRLGFDIDSISGGKRRPAKRHLRIAGEPGHELLVRIGEDQIDFEARAMLGEAQDQQFDRRLESLSILRDADNHLASKRLDWLHVWRAPKNDNDLRRRAATGIM